MDRDKQIHLLAFAMRRLMNCTLLSEDPDAAAALKFADRVMYVLAPMQTHSRDVVEQADTLVSEASG